MPAYDLEGADRITVGTSDVTIRIWNELDAAGETGLTREEIVERVLPHVNRGYARRRYLKRRLSAHKKNGSFVTGRTKDPAPTWESTEFEPAARYVIGQTLGNMVRDGSAIRLLGGRYEKARRPRHRDPRIIDMTGDRTRIHMNSVQALRILEPALARYRESYRAQLKGKEWEALLRLVELHKEMLRAASG